MKTYVMFAGSQGGHFNELMGLKELFPKYESILVTDNTSVKRRNEIKDLFSEVAYSEAMSNRREANEGNNGNVSRWRDIISYIKMFAECFKIYRKYQPAVIISTGSYLAVPLFLYGKLHGTKLVFIESNAKVTSKTMTGILVGWLSDTVVVQWPEMLSVYPKASYWGVIH